MLRLDNLDFSSGRAKFQDAPSFTVSRSARVYVKVAVEGMEEPFLALLDTGAEYSVLDHEIATEAGLGNLDGEPITLNHRHGSTHGKLVRASISMLADEGETLLVDATVFVPQEAWPTGRNFIGYTGFLERVKVGLDPQQNDIYFGG